MSTFDDLERALGIDTSDPEEALARDLVEADHDMLEALVHIRKSVAKMSGAEVADRMGRHRSVVTNFEKLTADPHLSTIRRYAHAIGARVTHHVEWVDPKGNGTGAAAEAPPETVGAPGLKKQLSDIQSVLNAMLGEGRSLPPAAAKPCRLGVSALDTHRYRVSHRRRAIFSIAMSFMHHSCILPLISDAVGRVREDYGDHCGFRQRDPVAKSILGLEWSCAVTRHPRCQ
ncbi:helix-turn-helix domain-containing protein [Nocardia spumae]|uniref:helix-turn-helix domain-containing protein n=1 Tax=Nocardia spumae TaxID=2887190 RepID=UPI001D134CA8|nr:helix-turn-helix transcriptional regulator [Nocardia spumae]